MVAAYNAWEVFGYVCGYSDIVRSFGIFRKDDITGSAR